MKMKTYLENLRKTVGFEKAVRICKQHMEETKLDNLSGLPSGSVFQQKDKQGNKFLNTKALQQTHNFWVEAYHTIKKM